MRKGSGDMLRNLRNRVQGELRGIHLSLMAVCAVLVALCGCVTAAAGAPDMLCCALLLPRLTPPFFLIFILRAMTCLLLGAAFGWLISSRERALLCSAYRGAVLISLLLLGELLWQPLLYSLHAPFFALLDLLLLALLALLTVLLLRRAFFTVTLALSAYLCWLTLRFCWCFSLVMMN